MILDGLTDDEKGAFASICKLTEHKAGDTIVKENEPGDTLLIIRQGHVEVRKYIEGSSFRKLKDLKQGDFFGEMSFLGQAPRSASVVAVVPTEVLELHERDFDDLIKDEPAIGAKIYGAIAREMASRLRKNNEELKRIVEHLIE
jgi:CRP-like cAMP-binding protein